MKPSSSPRTTSRPRPTDAARAPNRPSSGAPALSAGGGPTSPPVAEVCPNCGSVHLIRDEIRGEIVCADCGAWVSSELMGPDGAGEGADGDFRCSECRFVGEGP